MSWSCYDCYGNGHPCPEGECADERKLAELLKDAPVILEAVRNPPAPLSAEEAAEVFAEVDAVRATPRW